MLEPGSWRDKAAALPPGKRARIDHVCGPGRTLMIRHEQNGELHAWCFRCNDGGRWRREPSLKELVQQTRRLAEFDASLQRDAAGAGLPEPRIHDLDGWPPAARLWLYRAGLGRSEIARLGAAYLPEPDRVWLPLHNLRGELRYWTARAYQQGRQPKYLGAAERPAVVLAYLPVDVGAGQVEKLPVHGPLRQRPILTEDALSAFKISLAGHEAWPVMGTSVPPAYAAEILRRGAGCSLWLDPDLAGQRAAAKYGRQLRAYGVAVQNIVSKRDPKLHFLDEIKEILS